MNMIVDPKAIAVSAQGFTDKTGDYKAYLEIFAEEKTLTASAAQRIAKSRIHNHRTLVYEFGVGSACVTAALAEYLHAADEKLQLLIVGKEVKRELVIPALQTFARLNLPNTVLAFSNIEAPQLAFERPFFSEPLALTGTIPFAGQIEHIEAHVAAHWGALGQRSKDKDPALVIMYPEAVARLHPDLIPTPRRAGADDARHYGFDFMEAAHAFNLHASEAFKRNILFSLAENLRRPEEANSTPGALFVTHSIGGDSVQAVIDQLGLPQTDRFRTNRPETLFGEGLSGERDRYKITIGESIICRPSRKLDPENNDDVAKARKSIFYAGQLTDGEIEIVASGGKDVDGIVRQILHETNGRPTVRNASILIEPRFAG